MLVHAPKKFPPLGMMIADIGSPSATALAKCLDVTPRTVRRWIALDIAPKPVMMAIFWLTRWGRSQVDCKAVNDATMFAGLAKSLERENARLTHRVQRICQIADFGSANDPGSFFAGEKPGSMASPLGQFSASSESSQPIRVTIPSPGLRPRSASPSLP